jgi:hypothetical protein
MHYWNGVPDADEQLLIIVVLFLFSSILNFASKHPIQHLIS